MSSEVSQTGELAGFARKLNSAKERTLCGEARLSAKSFQTA